MRLAFWRHVTRAEKIKRNVERRFGVRVEIERSPLHWNGAPGWSAYAWSGRHIEDMGFGGSPQSAVRRLHRRLSRGRRGLIPDNMVARFHRLWVPR